MEPELRVRPVDGDAGLEVVEGLLDLTGVKQGDGLVVHDLDFAAVVKSVRPLRQHFVFGQFCAVSLKCRDEVMDGQIGLAKEDVKAAQVVVEEGRVVRGQARFANLRAKQLLGFLMMALENEKKNATEDG